MRLVCSSEYYKCHSIERFGFARSHHGLSSFPPTCAVFLATPAPVFLRLRVHPLLSFDSPLEYVLLFTCSPPASVEHLPWDSLSPSRHEYPESTHRLASQSNLGSALSVSHALDGLLLLAPCELVSSHCHVRDLLFRGFPRQSAALTHRQTVPSCC
jgi:hypothetical protein